MEETRVFKPDYIYDFAVHQYGAETANHIYTLAPADQERCRGFTLYRKLCSTNTLLTEDKTITSLDLAKLILMHYRFFTADQYRMLCPWASQSILSHHSEDIREERTRKHRVKHSPALKVYEISYPRICYMLTSMEYDIFTSWFPEEYLIANKIPGKSPVPPKSPYILHQLYVNNTPFRVLAGESFVPFRWYRGIQLYPTTLIKDSIDALIPGNQSIKKKGSKTADGVMEFDTNNKTHYVLVEQDMGTERRNSLEEKDAFYGSLFENSPDAQYTTVLYNSAKFGTEKKVKDRCKQAKRKDSYLHSLALLEEISRLNNITTVSQYFEYFLSRDTDIAEPMGAPERKKLASINNMLNDFKSNDADYDPDKSGIMEVRKFVNREVRKYTEPIKAAEKSHAEKMRSESVKYAYSTEGIKLQKALMRGLSYVIINRIEFDENAEYILPFASNALDRICQIASHSSLYDCVGNLTFKHTDEPVIGNALQMRNHFTASVSGMPDLVVEDVAVDVGGIVRAKALIESFDSSVLGLNLILLVRDRTDTEAFIRACPGFYSKVSSNPDALAKGSNLHLAFIEYGNEDFRPYMLYANKPGKYYLSMSSPI